MQRYGGRGAGSPLSPAFTLDLFSWCRRSQQSGRGLLAGGELLKEGGREELRWEARVGVCHGEPGMSTYFGRQWRAMEGY